MAKFHFEPAEASKAKRAAETARKLGESAAKACEKAELDTTEAMELAGYADEAELRLGKMSNGVTELTRGHCRALCTGIRRILADLTKETQELELRFIETNEVAEGAQEYRALLTKIRQDDPEFALDANTTITFSAGGHDPVTLTGRQFTEAVERL